MPVASGDVLFGQPVTARRVHSVRTLGKSLGLDVQRLRKVLASAGIIAGDMLAYDDDRCVFDAAAGLALHEWFVRHGRPVPSFLVLDQPSQVYFPEDHSGDRSIDDLQDTDPSAVIRLFELLRDVVAELNPGLQIIVTEHADIDRD